MALATMSAMHPTDENDKYANKICIKKRAKKLFLFCLINVPADHQVNVSWGWSLTQEIVCYPFKTQFHTNHINNQNKDTKQDKKKTKTPTTSTTKTKTPTRQKNKDTDKDTKHINNQNKDKEKETDTDKDTRKYTDNETDKYRDKDKNKANLMYDFISKKDNDKHKDTDK